MSPPTKGMEPKIITITAPDGSACLFAVGRMAGDKRNAAVPVELSGLEDMRLSPADLGAALAARMEHALARVRAELSQEGPDGQPH